MRRLVATATVVGVFSLISGLPGLAGYDYREKLDRFEGIKTVRFDASMGSECNLDASTKGSLDKCVFIHSTESSVSYPSVMFFKYSEGWDLLNYKNSIDDAPVIITYANGVVKRRRLKATLSTDTVYGGTVQEVVDLILTPIKNELPRIKKIELQYGSAEFSWIIDTELVKKALVYVGNGN